MVQIAKCFGSTSKKLIDAVEEEIQIQLEALPRKEIAEKLL
jgi:histidinol dehydrogenase